MTEVNKVGQPLAQSWFQEKTSTFSYKSKASSGSRHNQNNFFDPEIHDVTSIPVSNLFSLSLSPVFSAKIAVWLKYFLPEWSKLISDQTMLDCSAHYHIDFIDTVYLLQHTVTNQITFFENEQRIIDSEILKLLEKGIIEPCVPETGESITTVFLRPKKDGNYRMTLNLKRLNSFVEYHIAS